jgi:hypothetical protein
VPPQVKAKPKKKEHFHVDFFSSDFAMSSSLFKPGTAFFSQDFLQNL